MKTTPIVNRDRSVDESCRVIDRLVAELRRLRPIMNDCGHSRLYQTFLESLPDWMVDALANIVKGDMPTGQVLRHMVTEVGWLLHGKPNQLHARFSVANDLAETVADIIVQDLGRLLLQSRGLLQGFVPHPDPFELRSGCLALELGPRGQEATGETRAMLETVLEAARCPTLAVV